MLLQITEFLLETLVAFFVYLLLARFYFQWLRVSFRNQLGEFLIRTTNWVVLPARRVIPSFAGVDLASWCAAWLLQTIGLLAVYSLRGWEFGSAPGIALAALLSLALVDLLRFSIYILVFALIMQAVLSWVNPHTPFGPVFGALTRPFLRPFRRFVPPVANIDLTPLVLLVLLQVLLIPVAHLRGMLGGML